MLVIVHSCQSYLMGLRGKSSRSVAMEPMISAAILRIEVQPLSFLPEKMPRLGSRGTVSISLLPEMKISVVYTALVEKDGKKKVTIIVVT